MEEFVPKSNVEIIPANAPLPQEITDPKMKASLKLAEVTQDREVMNLLSAGILWKQTIQTIPMVENAEQYANAIDTFTKIKAAIKLAASLKAKYIAFPNEFVKLVRAMWKPLELNLMESKTHMGKVISDYDAKLRKEQEEAEAKAREEEMNAVPSEIPAAEDGEIVKVESNIPAPIPTVQKTETGGKVRMMDSIEVEIVDKVKLLKAIVSNGKGNAKYTEDLIEVREPKVRELIKGNPKLRKIPGVRFEKKKIAV